MTGAAVQFSSSSDITNSALAKPLGEIAHSGTSCLVVPGDLRPLLVAVLVDSSHAIKGADRVRPGRGDYVRLVGGLADGSFG